MKSVRSLLEAVAVSVGTIVLVTSCASGPPPVAGTPAETPTAAAPVSETPAETASAPPISAGCPLTPAELKKALGDMVGPGEIVIDTSYSGYRCSYTLPPGSLQKKGTGGTVYTGSDAGSFVIDSHRYADNYTVGVATKGVNTSFGGSTPAAVFASAYSAEQESAAARLGAAAAEAVVQHPEIGAGTVSDGAGGFILSGTGDYWYAATVSNTKFNPEYQSNVLEVAKLLASKG